MNAIFDDRSRRWREREQGGGRGEEGTRWKSDYRGGDHPSSLPPPLVAPSPRTLSSPPLLAPALVAPSSHLAASALIQCSLRVRRDRQIMVGSSDYALDSKAGSSWPPSQFGAVNTTGFRSICINSARGSLGLGARSSLRSVLKTGNCSLGRLVTSPVLEQSWSSLDTAQDCFFSSLVQSLYSLEISSLGPVLRLAETAKRFARYVPLEGCV
jgi:hypothetical protein